MKVKTERDASKGDEKREKERERERRERGKKNSEQRQKGSCKRQEASGATLVQKGFSGIQKFPVLAGATSRDFPRVFCGASEANIVRRRAE